MLKLFQYTWINVPVAPSKGLAFGVVGLAGGVVGVDGVCDCNGYRDRMESTHE